ncbi:MAG: sulfatase-like hydrolase/transferase [Verrucomicrobiae bacterium]|nr:sulfatase-like hydrolase/transferase [Verrucomicrobiae bacterium]
MTLAAVVCSAAEKPNIIFIFADDLGWGDLGCYGHPYAKTPHLDKLASEGTRFMQFYAPGVTCCPSRTGFMTSKFPATFARYPASGGFSGHVTITELLNENGYATGHFGKWHIGPTQKPGTYGIDVIGVDNEKPKRRRDESHTRCRDAPIFDVAIRFIEKHKDQPFYVNVWGHIPHHAVNPPPTVLDAFGPLQVDESRFALPMQEKFALCKKAGGDVSRHMRAYLAEVQALDEAIGRLLRRLDELGLRSNTIVVFSSDQGPAPIREGVTDPIRLNAMGCAGPFRGGKHNQYEGGIRIPFIVRWPDRVTAGRVDNTSILGGVDWLPTLCALTGIPINPADFDGEDTSAAWLGRPFTRTKPLLWKTSAANSPTAIREGRWKLHYPNNKRAELELYDLETDPGERHNLARQQPDIVQRLSANVMAWQTTLPAKYEKPNPKEDEK